MELTEQLIRLLNEYNELGIGEQIDHDKFYLYSLITHSTAIEGSTVTEIENQLLFDEGITAKGRPMQEQLMNIDLKNAYEQSHRLAQKHTELTVDGLKALSAIVMKSTGGTYNTLQGSFDASKGDLRLVNVTAGFGGQSYLDYRKVPNRLADFCDNTNRLRAELTDAHSVIDQYLFSFDVHLDLVTIHPWVDGNGRMSRLIMNQIQFEFGLVPVRINKEDKSEYIQALIDSRERQSNEPFRNFMLREHIKNLQSEIDNFKRTQSTNSEAKGGQKMQMVDRQSGQKTREAILEMIVANGKVTSTQMAQTLGINRSAVSKHLKRLQDSGIIKREGPDKGGVWVKC